MSYTVTDYKYQDHIFHFSSVQSLSHVQLFATLWMAARQESLRRNGVAIMINKRVRNAVQFSSVTQSCPTLRDPMNCSTPGLPIHHHLSEFTQTHVHWVGDAIQPSHPLSSPSPPAPNTSQHQTLFQWVNSAWGGQSTGVSALASFPPKNTQDWSPLERTG